MLDKNDVEISELLIAAIISKLVLQGIRRQTLSITDLSLELSEAVDETLFNDAVEWLETEGIIRFTQRVPDTESASLTHFLGTCLTAYGFALVQQKSSASDGGKTLGQSIESTNADSVSYSKIGDFVGSVLGGFTKSVSS